MSQPRGFKSATRHFSNVSKRKGSSRLRVMNFETLVGDRFFDFFGEQDKDLDWD